MKSKFDWRAAYFNLVSLVGIIVFLIAAINGGHGLMRMIVPKLSMPQHEWKQVQSFEAYKNRRGKPSRAARLAEGLVEGPTEGAAEAQVEESEEELRREWAEHRELAIEGEKRRGLWNLLQALVTLVVAVPVYWWHRRGAKRLKDLD